MSNTPLVTGGTYRFLLTATKDGATWDLSGAAVYLLLRNPVTRVTVRKAATILVAADGTAYYDTLTTDLPDEGGKWARSWLVVQGPLSLPSQPQEFLVVRSLSP